MLNRTVRAEQKQKPTNPQTKQETPNKHRVAENYFLHSHAGSTAAAPHSSPFLIFARDGKEQKSTAGKEDQCKQRWQVLF